MSTEEVKTKAKETVKSVKELLVATKDVVHVQLSQQAPRVVNTLDGSLDRGSKILTDTLRTIDRRTSAEQLELLTAYRSFLQKQAELINRRIVSINDGRSKVQRDN